MYQGIEANDSRYHHLPAHQDTIHRKHSDNEPPFGSSFMTHRDAHNMKDSSRNLFSANGLPARGYTPASTSMGAPSSSVRSGTTMPGLGHERTSRRARIAASSRNGHPGARSGGGGGGNLLPPRSKSYDDSSTIRNINIEFGVRKHDDAFERPTVTTPRSARLDQAESAVASRPPPAAFVGHGPIVRRQSTAPCGLSASISCLDYRHHANESNSSLSLYGRQHSNESSSNHSNNSASNPISSSSSIKAERLAQLDQAESAVASRPPTAICVPGATIRRQSTTSTVSCAPLMMRRTCSNNTHSTSTNNTGVARGHSSNTRGMPTRSWTHQGRDYPVSTGQAWNANEGSARNRSVVHDNSNPGRNCSNRAGSRSDNAAYGRSMSNPDSAVNYSRKPSNFGPNQNNHYDSYDPTRMRNPPMVRGDMMTDALPSRPRVRRHMSHDPPRILTSAATTTWQRQPYGGAREYSGSDGTFHPATATRLVELEPGVTAVIRAKHETMMAIAQGFLIDTSCIACTVHLRCIANAKFILCPVCSVVSPLFGGTDDEHGVALGFTEETLEERLWQSYQQ